LRLTILSHLLEKWGQAALDAFLTAWNKDPKPLVWTATVESITEKLSRCRQTLEKIQPGCTSPRSGKRKK
jgi:hypothetical protein